MTARGHGFIYCIFLCRTPFLAFGRTYTFSMDPTHFFMKETSDLLGPDHAKTCLYGRALEKKVIKQYGSPVEQGFVRN